MAENEARFREINESLEHDVRALCEQDEKVDFVCECARPDCRATVPMTCGEYEHVRANPIRFSVAPGHAMADVERVMEHHEGYLVIEKIEAGADVAIQSDPRA